MHTQDYTQHITLALPATLTRDECELITSHLYAYSLEVGTLIVGELITAARKSRETAAWLGDAALQAAELRRLEQLLPVQRKLAEAARQ